MKKMIISTIVALSIGSSSLLASSNMNDKTAKAANEIGKKTADFLKSKKNRAKLVLYFYIKNGLKSKKDMDEFRTAYNTLYKVNKPKRIDSITWLDKSYMSKDNVIYFKKVVKGNQKDIDTIYNKVLKNFGPKKDVKNIIAEFSKYLAYDNASKICTTLNIPGFFKLGGKFKTEIDDQINNKDFVVTITNKNDCKKIFETEAKISNDLKQKVIRYMIQKQKGN